MLATPKLKTIEWSGKQITKSGLYSKIPLQTYHRGDICDGPSVSSSGLRTLFSQSPAHFYCWWPGNPKRIEQEDKKHFVLGRAMHHLMLGEPFFAKLFAAPPPEYPDKKTGELKPWTYQAGYCKDWRDEQEKAGKAVLATGDVDAIRGMAASLQNEPLIKDIGVLNGLIERSIFWRDKETGLWLKSRPDNIPQDSSDFIDLKTTTSVLWYDMQRAIEDNGYFQQGALVRSAARELGIPNPSFTLIFVEKTPPYCVDIVTLKEHELDRGERANRMAIDKIAECIKAKQWPGPRGNRADARYIEMTDNAQKRIDDKLTYGI